MSIKTNKGMHFVIKTTFISQNVDYLDVDVMSVVMILFCSLHFTHVFIYLQIWLKSWVLSHLKHIHNILHEQLRDVNAKCIKVWEQLVYFTVNLEIN